MKKYILSFVLVAILFACSFEKGEAQPCPTGYSETTATFTYMGCDYIVDFCFQCSPTHGDMKVNINWFSVSNQTCYEYMVDHFSEIIIFAKNYILLNYSSTLCDGVLPCNQGSRPTYIYTPNCWQVFHHCASGIDEFILRPCDDVYFCKSTYYTCLDYNYSPPKLISTFIRNDQIGGTPPCPTTKPVKNLPCGAFSDCWQPSICE